ncbi:hypothetical protein ACPCVO_37695 [Streptomyces umbrinus]|uniref:hypothetical protein n=1 Tax=Streptomyces umbrinus TaxID=67370 RepID=UPI003C2F89B4
MESRTMRGYLPLMIVPIFAVLINLTLIPFDQTWTLSDWATNVVLALVVTMVGGMLARRQQEIQEALADLEMTEKIAVLALESGSIKRKGGSEASVICQTFFDARAGLSLLTLARTDMQREYLAGMARTMKVIEGFTTFDLIAYQAWSPEGDWVAYKEAARSLAGDLRLRKERCAQELQGAVAELETTLEGMLMLTEPPNVSPRSFMGYFASGGNRIRVSLNWDLLLDLAGEGTASINMSNFGMSQVCDAEIYFTPWYQNGDGVETSWSDPGAAALSVIDASERVSGQRQLRLAQIQSWLTSQSDGTCKEVCIATIALPEGKRLVLDGNHRLVAAVPLLRRGVRVEVREFLVTAPLSDDLLPDLVHWQTTAPS